MRIVCLAWVALAALGGCAQDPRAAFEAVEALAPVREPRPDPEVPPPLSTVLLPVSFINLVRPGPVPAALELEVTAPDDPGAVTFVQPVALSAGADTTGAAEYLFRLMLPQGRYRIARIGGAQRGGERAPRFSVPVDLPFAVTAYGTRYMGRLVVQNVGAKAAAARQVVPGLHGGVLVFNTAWSVVDDLARYAGALAAVPAGEVERRPFDTFAVAGAEARSFESLDVAVLSTTLTPPPIVPGVPVVLPQSDARLRAAFGRFLAARPPKAFAVADGGQWGSASARADASTRALLECTRKAPRCRLFAVDDRLVTERRP